MKLTVSYNYEAAEKDAKIPHFIFVFHFFFFVSQPSFI